MTGALERSSSARASCAISSVGRGIGAVTSDPEWLDRRHRSLKSRFRAAIRDAAAATNPVDRADALDRAEDAGALCREIEDRMGMKR
jgi:hypothetical protein